MSKIRNVVLVALVLAAFPVATAMAADGAEAAGAPAAKADMTMARGLAIIGACWGAGFAAVAGGIGIGRIGGSCIEAIARQPEAAGALFAPMIISAAMVEGGMLFAIVVCLMGILA